MCTQASLESPPWTDRLRILEARIEAAPELHVTVQSFRREVRSGSVASENDNWNIKHKTPVTPVQIRYKECILSF